jgi:6,7-dimethyl-8-ribityllumazine synthase
MREHRGTLDGSRLRVGLVRSRFNESVTRGLLDGALAELAELKVPDDHVTLCEVPGALEIPVVLRALAARHDALVALGCVIRGETDHYEHVCQGAVGGAGQVALATGVPVGVGVITCETLAQARERSGPGPKNLGRSAVRAAVETASLLAALRAEGGA